MKNIVSILNVLFAVAVLACVSCQRNFGLEEHMVQNDGIIFTVGNPDSGTSAAASLKGICCEETQTVDSVVLKCDALDTTFTLYATVSRMTGGPEVGESAITKGQEIDSKNIAELRNGTTGKEGKLRFTAYSAEDGSQYIPSSDLRFSGDWKTSDIVSIWDAYDKDGVKQEYFWPSFDLSFFAWSYSPGKDYTLGLLDQASFDGKKGIMSFRYTMPTPAENPATARDADNQRDVMFASKVTSRTDNNEVRLSFDHILSAIKFEVGKTNDIMVKSISLENVMSVGTCSYDPNDPVKPIDWTGLMTPAKYIQTYTEAEGTIHEDLDFKPDCGRDPQKVGSATTTFMVIPQTSGDGGNEPLKLTMVFIQRGQEITITADLTKEQATWRPGYEYKYTFNMTNGLDIEIDDTVNNNVKSDLEIMNVGGKPAYLRVLLAGCWADNLNSVLASWSDTDATTGTFDFNGASGMNTADWIKGVDGFYYYKHILQPGQSIPAGKMLFTTYTLLNKPEGLVDEAHLELTVVSQAVLADSGKASLNIAWPKAPSGLDSI